MRVGSFAGKVVLVSGGSSGIGRACAVAIGAEGGSVVVGGRRSERLQQVVERIQAAGGQAHAVAGDVRDPGTGPAWVRAVVERFGGLDGLVNAAGVIGSGSVVHRPVAGWGPVMGHELRSAYLMTRSARPELAER